MAGSALNWTEENYNTLLEQLVLKTVVILTGTESDEPWLKPLRERWLSHPRVRWAQSRFSLQELLYILKKSYAVVAPSTGVSHLAAAVGAKSIGLYSPVLAHHPTRWAARGPRVRVLLPSVHCLAKNKCLGVKCAQYFCMKNLTPEQVLRSLFDE